MVSTADPLSITPADLRSGDWASRPVVSPMAGLCRAGRARRTTCTSPTGCCSTTPLDGGRARLCGVADLPSLEPGGPREYIYFDPPRTRAAIVTCGGLCPGLNNVIRGLVLELADNYGVTEVLGFRDGFRGLVGDAEPRAG